jgi:hypothetical protein
MSLQNHKKKEIKKQNRKEERKRKRFGLLKMVVTSRF